MNQPSAEDKGTCPDCGRPLDGDGRCRCASAAEPEMPEPGHTDQPAAERNGEESTQFDLLHSDEVQHHEISALHEPAEQAPPQAAPAARAHWRRKLLLAAVIALNILVLGGIIGLLSRAPGPGRRSGSGRIRLAPGPGRRPVQAPIEYVSAPGTAARLLEEKLYQAGIFSIVEGIKEGPGVVEVGLTREAAWDMAELRANIESDALLVLRTLASECPNVRHATIVVRARLEGEDGMTMAEAFRLSCALDQAASALKRGGSARQALGALGASYHPRINRE